VPHGAMAPAAPLPPIYSSISQFRDLEQINSHG
jgi:hypothetical protein